MLSGVGPLKAKFIVKDYQVINLSSGSGTVSTLMGPTGIQIKVNQETFESTDVVGPYVVTNEFEVGKLVQRPMTSEDEHLLQVHEQQIQQALDNAFQAFTMVPMWTMPPFPSFAPMAPMGSMMQMHNNFML